MCTARGRPTCSGCVRATGAKEARRAASPEAGGSTCSGAATGTGTAWARSGCRRPSCSRTTAASPSPVTGSRSSPRPHRRCGSATSRHPAGRSPARAPATRSRGTLMAASSTGRPKECHGSRRTRWSWSRTRPNRSRTAAAGPRISRSTSSVSPPGRPGAADQASGRCDWVLGEALRYEQRVLTQHREPVVHPLGIGGVPPAGKQPRGVGERQPAFHLVDLQRERDCLRAARLDGCRHDGRQAALARTSCSVTAALVAEGNWQPRQEAEMIREARDEGMPVVQVEMHCLPTGRSNG